VNVGRGESGHRGKCIKYLTTTRTSRNQKGPGLPGNYKLQITNYKQITIPKLQIPNKGVSFGQILNAFGEEHKVAFFNFEKSVKNFWSVNDLY
jgi:hypothetical protein